MSNGNSFSKLKKSFAALEESLKTQNKQYKTCKQNIDNMQSEAVKALFSKKAYELALNKCNLLIDLFNEKKSVDRSMQKLEQCVELKKLYECSGQLTNVENKIIEMDRLIQQIISVDKEAKKSSFQEDANNAINFIKPYCQYVTPNDPNYDAIMEFCGKGVDDASL